MGKGGEIGKRVKNLQKFPIEIIVILKLTVLFHVRFLLFNEKKKN